MPSLPVRRRRGATIMQVCCVGWISWQVTVCHGITFGRAFLGWRPNHNHNNNDNNIIKPDNNQKATVYPPPFLFGWRGGAYGENGYGGSSASAQQHEDHPSQQQQNPQNHQQQTDQYHPQHQPQPHQQQQQQHPQYTQNQYNPQQQQQQQQHRPPPDLPPDLPYGDPSGNTGYHPQQQQGGNDPYQNYPPPPMPGSQQQNQHYPMTSSDPPMPSPYGDAASAVDPLMMMEEEGPGATPWDDTGVEDEVISNEPDLSSFDKEYIMKGLARLYRKKILPIELSSRYGHFHSPPLSPADFDAPPAVLLLGPFSVGKTSFIKYLLGRDFPGIRVGPEPTTDRFTAVLWGSQDKIIPGAALCAQNFRPFTGLGPFGNAFLSRMEGVELDSAILRNITLIDTPGILSGAKQRDRNYDYEAVMKWFAERADLIIIMFDAHKLDISDEMKQVMELMIPHLDKVRIILNKADTISTQQLMRVYGALMWSLGKVMNTPEVCRVYMGSFWDKPLQETDQQVLLRQEEMDLFDDIMRLPQQAVMRRINEMVKRARSVKVHAYIIHYLRKQLPYSPWHKRDKQRRLIGRLEQEFLAAARRYGLPKGDFPSVDPMRRALTEIKDLSEFPKLDKKMVREMEKVFSTDIPDLLEKARERDARNDKKY